MKCYIFIIFSILVLVLVLVSHKINRNHPNKITNDIDNEVAISWDHDMHLSHGTF